ncbi:MAG: mycothiol system anti-sigma-R factor [Burkholderiales bacterium]
MTKQPMTCEEVLEHLFAFLDRELDDKTSAEVEHHLEGCRGCFSRAEFERSLKAHVRDSGESAAPESLRARLKYLIEKF